MNGFRKVMIIFFMALLATAAACQSETAGVPEVTFVGSEYAYDGPESIEGGWTTVTLDNQGELAHDLILMRLLDGKTVDDAMAMLADESAPPAWIDVKGGTTAEAGSSASFASELEAGTYVMFSFGAEENAPPDAAQGMVGELTVTEAKTTVDESELPEAEGTISLVDYQFVINGLQSGEQVVQVSNDGTELHEAVMFRLNEGKTFADFQSFMEAGENSQGPPPAEQVSSVFLSPGNVTYSTMNLDTGNYVFLCFIPSEKNDNTPHFMLGMMTEVAVS